MLTTTSHRQELIAEFALLALHDQIRRQGRYDYGCGQRTAELRRRRLFLRERGAAELVELTPSVLIREPDPAVLLAAFERVAVPRMRRAGSYRSSAWMTVLYRLAKDCGCELLEDRETLERENGRPVDVDTAVEVYTSRRRI
jgi:hypothetical protein